MTKSARPAPLLIGAALVALVLPLAVTATAADADAPIPTTTYSEGNEFPIAYGDTIYLSAFVYSDSGTPTGTVTFTDDRGQVLAADVPVDGEGQADAQGVADFVGTRTYLLSFHGTGGYGGSSSTRTARCCFSGLDPQPTVARISTTGGRPQVTLTTSAYLRSYQDFGRLSPVAGQTLVFTVGGRKPSGTSLGGGTVVCRATTDVWGFASCRGKGTIGALASVLAGGSWVTHPYAGRNDDSVKAKVIAVG